MVRVPLEEDKIEFLLVGGMRQKALEGLRATSYTNIEFHKDALDTEQLKESIRDAHFIGLRPHTHLTEDVIDAAGKLVVIGCFYIGTNQVDLNTATKCGIPVFDAPFSNTHSVAELAIDELLLLLHDVSETNAKAHRGVWNKLATGSFEACGKKLGVISYDHTGTQLGILAESLGIRVCFYNTENRLPLGNATRVQHLSDLLNMSDVASLHVSENTSTKNLMGTREITLMKPGALLINATRGTVVDVPALCDALVTKHLAGTAIGILPAEPVTNNDPLTSPLCDFDNVILTPHIGSSMLEAQENIGLGVAGKLTKYSDSISTLSAVSFPEVSLPLHGDRHLMHIHEDRPGVLTALNQIFVEQGVNIAAQYLQTSAQVGCVVVDIEADEDVAEKALLAMKTLPEAIRARLLY